MTTGQKYVAWLMIFTICLLVLVLIRTGSMLDKERLVNKIDVLRVVYAERKLVETERHLKAILATYLTVTYNLDKVIAVIVVEKAYDINDGFVGIGRTRELIDSLLFIGWEDSIAG